MNQPQKRPCTATRKDGQPCRAWAMRGSDPAICSTHARRNVGAGAPAGNDNALKHGFYRSALTPEELADIITHADNMTLIDELAITRIMMRRLLKYTQSLDERDAAEIKAAAPLIFTGARTVAHLLRQLDGESTLQDALDDVLDALAAGVALEL